MLHQSNRREFVRNIVSTGSAIALSALSYSRVQGANDRFRIASIGTGGKGWSDLTGVAASPSVEVAALCNIDHSAEHLGRAAETYPSAKRMTDWRKLLDDSNDIDAVIVSTPDFMHAPIALAAMHLRKHVFCQKPLTHTVFEARQMNLAARSFGLVTQMGNQIQSHTAYRTAVKAVHDGVIGQVIEVHSWQGGSPSWPRHIDRPVGADPVPDHVDWDLWQGVADRRPYKKDLYHAFSWRGWQAYGTGQLGDFGCHILDPVFKSLELTAPTQLVAEAPPIKAETWTDRATIRYRFPGTTRTAGSTIDVTWYDAVGARPPRERLSHIPSDYELPNAGSVLVGEKGSLVIPHVAMPRLFLGDSGTGNGSDSPLTIVDGVDHYVQWADACRGVDQTTSSFDYSGPLTETVLLGTVAIRMPGETLQWDSDSMRISNAPAAEAYLSKSYRDGWEPTWV
ncbi:Gfo/Idh/MocA family protein [Neorhodopirellula pilleata]|uniref:1,5-anhydro-D-fructose reductase n=1 Tax=Neorhodopirellula pilleata TaxID=2714738 RepID=A0A5C5ZY57_9BACT|nr:Gfo/Idh/MocA family oxidoreductase [Neorhodopirellula pilleata]TWT91847.1 1,5-anhydro-D-fructose reductase [Neorhodopirellula pilleata]